MKKLVIVPVLTLLLMVSFIFAGEFADLHKSVMEARDSLVTLMKDKNKRGPAQQKLVKDTADAVSAKITKMKAPAGKEKEFAEMSKNWADFKKTREEELVPLILEGKEAKAKEVAMGVQKVRLKKVLDLCDQLDK